MDRAGTHRAVVLAEVVKACLQRKSKRLLWSAAQKPVLDCYSADGTPSLLWVTASQEGLSKGSVRRAGKVLVELFVQRASLRSRGPQGSTDMALLMAEPIPLSKGKKTGHIFAAACAFWPMLRSLGHDDICITHLSFDRGHTAL